VNVLKFNNVVCVLCLQLVFLLLLLLFCVFYFYKGYVAIQRAHVINMVIVVRCCFCLVGQREPRSAMCKIKII
jgi:hypothetical protein